MLRLTMAGTWMPTITAKMHSSRVNHHQSDPSFPLLVGIRKYAARSADTDMSPGAAR